MLLVNGLGRSLGVNLESGTTETDQPYLCNRRIALQERLRLAHRDAGGAFHWEPVNPGADGWKSNGADAMLLDQCEAASIAACQQIIFPVPAITPDRAGGMDDPLGRQPAALGDFRLAGRATAQLPAFLEQLRPGNAMNRAVHTAAA